MDLLTQVGVALTAVIGWIGQVVSALVTAEGALNALLPLLAVGVSISVLRFAVGAIRSFIWGA